MTRILLCLAVLVSHGAQASPQEHHGTTQPKCENRFSIDGGYIQIPPGYLGAFTAKGGVSFDYTGKEEITTIEYGPSALPKESMSRLTFLRKGGSYLPYKIYSFSTRQTRFFIAIAATRRGGFIMVSAATEKSIDDLFGSYLPANDYYKACPYQPM